MSKVFNIEINKDIYDINLEEDSLWNQHIRT